MERLCNLLFELSKEDGLRIPLKLQEKPMRLTHLSDELDFTIPETFRRLSGLSEATRE